MDLVDDDRFAAQPLEAVPLDLVEHLPHDDARVVAVPPDHAVDLRHDPVPALRIVSPFYSAVLNHAFIVGYLGGR